MYSFCFLVIGPPQKVSGSCCNRCPRTADHSADDGDHLPQAAADYLEQIKLLMAAPTRAKYVLALDDYGRGSQSASGDAYKQSIFDGLLALVRPFGLGGLKGYAFVDLKYIWDAVLGTAPGYAAFGYRSDGACVANSSSVAGECADPAHTFYWIPGYAQSCGALMHALPLTRTTDIHRRRRTVSWRTMLKKS
jgi:hypothetical protein